VAKILLLIAIVAVVVVVARVLRSRSHHSDDPAAHRRTHPGKLAADQAVIGRQGGQGAHQGGVGGGFGPI
jgi:hypothetical protein